MLASPETYYVPLNTHQEIGRVALLKVFTFAKTCGQLPETTAYDQCA